MSGQLLKEEQVVNTKKQMNLNGFVAGMNILQIANDNQVREEHIIKL